MESRDDRRRRLQQAHWQLERAALYVVAARELVGADNESGQAVEDLRQELLAVAESLRAPD
jgi:hypothetical protein